MLCMSKDMNMYHITVYAQAPEVWSLNPLKCLKYEITLALRSYVIAMYTTVNFMLFRPNRTSSTCGLCKIQTNDKNLSLKYLENCGYGQFGLVHVGGNTAN